MCCDNRAMRCLPCEVTLLGRRRHDHESPSTWPPVETDLVGANIIFARLITLKPSRSYTPRRRAPKRNSAGAVEREILPRSRQFLGDGWGNVQHAETLVSISRA
jgi:hypothetical protein